MQPLAGAAWGAGSFFYGDDMNKEKDMNTFDLVVRNNLLPAQIEELVPLSFIGQSAVNYYREKISLMKKLGLEDQKAATLADGQASGIMLLDIERRIGEELADSRIIGRDVPGNKKERDPGSLSLKEIGIEKDQSKNAQQIARHPEAVEQVIQEALENEDIPTKTAVLNKIKKGTPI